MSVAVWQRELQRLTARIAPPVPPETWSATMQRIGFVPDSWQARVLKSTARRLLLNASRQSGKSSIAAILALRQALMVPRSLTLIVSPGERQSGLLFRRVLDLYRRAGEPIPAEIENRLSLELRNGSAIYALPGNEQTVRGYSAVDLLIVDEASRVDDDLFHAVTPMMAVSGGQIVALSTPAGKRGWWYQTWAEGGAAWERYEVPATACPRIPPAFLEEERRSMPSAVFAEEYLCLFAEASDAYFRPSDIAAAFTTDVRPLFAPEAAHVA